MIPIAILIVGTAALCALRWAPAPRFLRRCRPCGYDFATRAGLARHRKTAHNDI